MDVEQLRLRIDRRPFLPFRVHLVDGRSFEVREPHWTWVIPPYRRVFIARPEPGRGRSLPIEEIDATFITSIEELPPGEDAGCAAA